jgi:hypothetical protein
METLIAPARTWLASTVTNMEGGALRRRTNVHGCGIRGGLAGARPSSDVVEMSKVMNMEGGTLRRRTNVHGCGIRGGLAGARPSSDVVEMSKVMNMEGGTLRRRTNVRRCGIRAGLAGARPSIDVREGVERCEHGGRNSVTPNSSQTTKPPRV